MRDRYRKQLEKASERAYIAEYRRHTVGNSYGGGELSKICSRGYYTYEVGKRALKHVHFFAESIGGFFFFREYIFIHDDNPLVPFLRYFGLWLHYNHKYAFVNEILKNFLKNIFRFPIDNFGVCGIILCFDFLAIKGKNSFFRFRKVHKNMI